MADISTIDIPTAVTAIFVLITAIGGIAGKNALNLIREKLGQVLEGFSLFTDVMAEFGQLMITVSKAGEDNVLSPEEWTNIKNQFRAIQEKLLQLKGKFGSIME